tara:strand:- start:225 stop:437 length:213 start_codon:yes stop_codon:yes gene_type:complete
MIFGKIFGKKKDMLSTKYRLELTDICCRIMSQGPVTLDERIWMNKLCDHNLHAKELAGALLCPDFVEDRL